MVILDFVMMLEVFIEIHSITLLCCDDAKALLADYYCLCIVISF